jgi:GDP-L-fucose synthase
MRILVTGASGMIGTALVSSQSQHEILGAARSDADLTSYEETFELLKSLKPDAVVHAAALVGGIGGNTMKSGQYFRDNILINTNVLEASRACGIENLTTFMSTCIFPDEAKYPLTVDQLHSGEPHSSNFAYAYAKRMLDVQVRAYNKQFKTRYKIVIPTNVYGPNDNFNLIEGHAVPALIHRMYLAKQNNTSFEVWGTGRARREFVFSEDIALLTLGVVERHSLDNPLILTNSSETTILGLVDTIKEIMGFQGEIRLDPTKPDGQLRKPSSDLDFRRLFPDFRFTDLQEGLEKTVRWFVSRYPDLRI